MRPDYPRKYAYPHGNLLYRKFGYEFPCIVSGEGIYLIDGQGRRYLDACSGAMVAALGHGNQEIVSRMAAQAGKLAYVNGMYFTNEPAEALAKALCQIAPHGLNKAFFLSSGTEATEAAIKLVRQYWLAKDQPRRQKIIGRVPSYHGSTLGAVGLGARRVYQAAFRALYFDHPKIAAPICYRCPWGKTYPHCDYECAHALELMIKNEEPETVAAFIAEPVIGAAGTAMAPPEHYYRRIADICKKYGILFIADEILCGMGRTGDWFAISSYGVTPDIMLVGKGLAAGVAAISAMLARSELVDAIWSGGHDFMHAQTFAHHPVACAAALATIEYMQAHGIVTQARAMGGILHRRLESLRAHPLCGDLRGRGLLAGIEFVDNRARREPFPRAWNVADRVLQEGLKEQIVLWKSVGQVDGVRGDGIIIAPPLIISEEEIAELIKRLTRALDTVAEQVAELRVAER